MTFHPDFQKHKEACKISSNGPILKKLKKIGIVRARRKRSDEKENVLVNAWQNKNALHLTF